MPQEHIRHKQVATYTSCVKIEVNLQATWKSLNTNLFPLFQSIW